MSMPTRMRVSRRLWWISWVFPLLRPRIRRPVLLTRSPWLPLWVRFQRHPWPRCLTLCRWSPRSLLWSHLRRRPWYRPPSSHRSPHPPHRSLRPSLLSDRCQPLQQVRWLRTLFWLQRSRARPRPQPVLWSCWARHTSLARGLPERRPHLWWRAWWWRSSGRSRFRRWSRRCRRRWPPTVLRLSARRRPSRLVLRLSGLGPDRPAPTAPQMHIRGTCGGGAGADAGVLDLRGPQLL